MVLGCVSKLEGLSLASVHTVAHRTIYSIIPVWLHGERLAQGKAPHRERLSQGKAGNRKHRAWLANAFRMEISKLDTMFSR